MFDYTTYSCWCHKVFNSILFFLSLNDSIKWYQHISRYQLLIEAREQSLKLTLTCKHVEKSHQLILT